MSPEEVCEIIKGLEKEYNRLFLIVGNFNTGKTKLLKNLSESLTLPVVNLNYELSKKMNSLSAKERALEAQTLFEEVIEAQGSSIVLLDNIELLFDPELKLNPLVAMKKVSKNITVVSTWLGYVKDKYLLYAEEGYLDKFSNAIEQLQHIDLNSAEV